MVLLKEFFEKVDFEKNQQTTKRMENYPVGEELIKEQFKSFCDLNNCVFTSK